MIGRRKAQVRSLERRVADLSNRVHVLEQHRRVELNRLAVPMTDEMRVDRAFIEAKDLAAQCAREYIATTGLTTPTTPPGFLREGWASKPYRFGGATPEDIADHGETHVRVYGQSEDLR